MNVKWIPLSSDAQVKAVPTHSPLCVLAASDRENRAAHGLSAESVVVHFMTM